VTRAGVALTPSTPAVWPRRPTRFAHDSERHFAHILDFYAVAWEYEPVEFVLRWDACSRPTSAFRPDFWLPDLGLFVELTTMEQRLVTKKNAKVRRLARLYPDVRVTLLYQRDTFALLAKYGFVGGAYADSPARSA